MEQSPSWGSKGHSAIQETPRLFMQHEGSVHYRVHKILPLVPTMSQMYPVHTFRHYFLNIHFNIIFSSTRRSSKCSLPLSFSNQNIIWISYLLHAYHIPHASYPPGFDFPNNIRWSVKFWTLLVMQSSPAFRYFPPLRSKYSPRQTVPRCPQAVIFP